jgi:DNA-binding response OmpR family regulator
MKPIASAIERGLTDGYAVDVAFDGAEAIEKATVNNYDVVCLDLNLPKIDGIEVCRRLREDRFAGGIIMLTARSSIRERIEGLDQGADDYLVKPFAFASWPPGFGYHAPRRRPAGTGARHARA